MKLLIVGNPEPCHVGAFLLRAAEELGIEARLSDIREAWSGPRWLQRWNWRMRGRRPLRLRQFGEQAARLCREWKPSWMLATGLAPLTRPILAGIRLNGTRCFNFLTDDPWNPSQHAPWFIKALPEYDVVHTPRRANVADLQSAGCRDVRVTPFAYDPVAHRLPEAAPAGRTADVLFAGGADADRLPWIKAVLEGGLSVRLFGGYWDRHAWARPHWHGMADLNTLRNETRAAGCVLGLVRHANRDGHAMRSYEVPAMGGCLLAEDTPDHRELFGPEGEATLYFATPGQFVEKARWLKEHPDERERMRREAHQRVVGGQNTYADRLQTMLEVIGERVL